MKKIKFRGIEYKIVYFKYQNDRDGILMQETENLSHTINCTVNINSLTVLENQVVIKDWGDNKGVYELLLSENIIKSYSRRISIGLNHGLLTNLNI